MSELLITLDRATYKVVKGMDRQKMETWLNNVYKSGLNDASGSGVSLEDISNAIGGVKGIGETRKKEIMNVITALYETKKQPIEGDASIVDVE